MRDVLGHSQPPRGGGGGGTSSPAPLPPPLGTGIVHEGLNVRQLFRKANSCNSQPWPAVYINFLQIIHQIQFLCEPLCHAQAIFYSLPNNERGNKYRGLTYSAKQTVREICRATYSASQTRLRIYLTFSITIVQSIETPPNHPKTPQTSTSPNPNHYRIYSRYHIMRDFFRTLMAFSGGGGPGSGTDIVQEYI